MASHRVDENAAGHVRELCNELRQEDMCLKLKQIQTSLYLLMTIQHDGIQVIVNVLLGDILITEFRVSQM